MNDDFPLLGTWDTAQHTGVAAACVIITDSENRLLLQLRDAHTNVLAAGQWSLFGGRMEQGETPRQTALREIGEELGIALNAEHLHPLARTTSTHGTGLFAFTTPRVIAPADITLGEGAGFAFLTQDQIKTLPIVPSINTILHHFFEMNPKFG